MKKGIVISNNNVEYTLIEEIGGGGSGVVWKAQTEGSNYAIKFIKSNDKSKIMRFHKELAFCKTIQNKNIISIISYGKFEGIQYYIMTLYPKTLRDIINAEKDADILLKYIFQLCNAIKFIHKHRVDVIHRDIKPENILIDDKQLVLADFGIAHFHDSTLTKKGDILANRNYLAPEQKIKNNANNIGKPVDIYALGLIINECFTKHNPAGSNFKTIADNYPIYYELDNLVYKMIKQNANERPSIEDVIIELKFIHGKTKNNSQEIKNQLLNSNYPHDISKKTFNRIIKRASEDLLFAKITFENKTEEEISKYNQNWHMRIGYSVDDFLFNLYMQEKIYDICKRKFYYECNSSDVYIPLNLVDNKEHKHIFKRIKSILKKYQLNEKFEKQFDLSGKILKYFSSCCDYHCLEILGSIQDEYFSFNAKEKLINSTIILIIRSLKNNIKENQDLLARINLTDHVRIDWARTQFYETNDDDTELLESIYIEEEKRVNEILEVFKKEWKIFYNRLEEDVYSIKFRNYRQFDKFRKYAQKLSKPHYVLEGDVLDMVTHFDYSNGIVEIKLERLFEIPNTLAKILGLRTDY